MHLVGHHLQTTAISKTLPTERDLFARSAYNRYYYASFLAARSMLAGMSPDWQRLPHADYPGVLRGAIPKRFKIEQKKAIKSGDFVLEKQIRAGIDAAKALANILEKANATRVAADYSVIPVSFVGSDRFSLNSVEITEAHSWLSKVSAFSVAIGGVWRQLFA